LSRSFRINLLPVLLGSLLSLVAVPPARAVFGDDNNTAARTAGTVGAINISGLSHTNPELVLRVFGLHRGGPFTRQDLAQGWDNLEDCGYFRFVEIDYDDDDPANVTIDIALEEDMTTYFGPLMRYSRRHKYLLGAWLEERNLRGQGETLRVEASAVYLASGHVSWQRPYFAGVGGLTATLAAGGEAADFVFRPFRYRKWDADWDLRYQLGGDFFVGGGLRYGYFQQRDDTAQTAANAENHWAFNATAGFDSRDNRYYPQQGVLAQATVRNWQSSGFASYTEQIADLRTFTSLPWQDHILALHAWGRQVSAPTNLDNVLFFGGPETVRGYPFASREGEHGYLFSAEYRIPLFLLQISPRGEMVGFGFHLFGDAGDTWYDGAAAQVAQMSYGAGAHLNLDTWQLRFEAARTKEGVWAFEFMDKFNF